MVDNYTPEEIWTILKQNWHFLYILEACGWFESKHLQIVHVVRIKWFFVSIIAAAIIQRQMKHAPNETTLEFNF